MDGVLIGFEDFSNMAYSLKRNEEMLSKELGLTNGVPSHDTFSDVFRSIDVEKFVNVFIEWTKSLYEAKTGMHIAIDGKAIRAATEKAKNGNIPYILSAFLCDCGISIGQIKVDEKSNEIKGIPELLDLLDIEGGVITIDAIGTQVEIMNKIHEKKGDFCLQLKTNQGNCFDSVELFFKDLSKAELEKLDKITITEKNHGRVEKRTYAIYAGPELENIVDLEKFKHVKEIGMAILEREINGESSKEVHYHLLSKEFKATEYYKYARDHWKIENNLHWILDMHYNEDRCKDKAKENIALLRKIAFNLTKLDKNLAKKTTKKIMIDLLLDINVFKNLIFNEIPEKLLKNDQ